MRCPVLPLLQVSRILLLHSASRPVAMVLLMKASKHPTVKIIARATQSMHMPRPLIRGPRRWIWTRPSLRLRSNDNPPYIFIFCFFFFGPVVVPGSCYVFLFHGKRVSFSLISLLFAWVLCLFIQRGYCFPLSSLRLVSFSRFLSTMCSGLSSLWVTAWFHVINTKDQISYSLLGIYSRLSYKL